MDQKTNREIIMISIHPEYANAIFRGKKKIEFRKINIPRSIEQVILYVTAPEQKITGYFSVKEIIEDKPNELWHRFSSVSYTSKEFFDRYYQGQEIGVGLIVDTVSIFKRPFLLEEIGVKPPQSFLYINNTLWRKIKRRKIISATY